MIIAERKPLAELVDMIKDFDRVLLLACKGCVTVCSSGGEREVEILAPLLRMGCKKLGKKVEIVKFRRRKHYRRQQGHRQHYTELQIDSISAS